MKCIYHCLLALTWLNLLHAVDGLAVQTNEVLDSDTSKHRPKLLHRLEVDLRPSYLIPSISFLKGENARGANLRRSFSSHLKYAFQLQRETVLDQVYEGAYQGIGVGKYFFGNTEELGNPLAAYLFQGARIALLGPKLSANYEWNFGLSTGWRPYHPDYNKYNHVIGSDLNAYIHLNLYLNWMLSKEIDLTTGVHVTHFSNGNTDIPNAGINTVGLRTGIAYYFNRNNRVASVPRQMIANELLAKFPKHISYDVVAFGAWRRKGVPFLDSYVASPHRYNVVGLNFSAMYNLDYKLRVGGSLDGIYDGSANVYTEDYIVGTQQPFYTPSWSRQVAVGLSARTEYVMPYFAVGLGVGVHVLHRGGDMEGTYQVLTLKTKVTRNSFVHIGYNLKDFHEPNFLMLGLGFRFNNKYPRI